MGSSDEVMGCETKRDSAKKHKRKKPESGSAERHRKSRKRSSAQSGTCSSSSDEEKKRKKKRKREKKKHRKRSSSSSRPASVNAKPERSASSFLTEETKAEPQQDDAAKPKGPMTKEQWEKQQSVVKRVFDPDTQRMRLIRGDGEIIEEIVSRDRHLSINKAPTRQKYYVLRAKNVKTCLPASCRQAATRGDGAHFQSVLGLTKK